jgi:transcriptional regulator with XRE-family HTH domain
MRLEKRLRELREARGLSVKEVAANLKMSESTYRGYEYGAKLPAHRVPYLCQKLGVTLEEFFNLQEESKDMNEEFKIVIRQLEFGIKRLWSFVERTNLKNDF